MEMIIRRNVCISLTKNQNSTSHCLGSCWVLYSQSVVSAVSTITEPHLQLGARLVGLNVSPGRHFSFILLPGDGGEGDTLDGSHQGDVCSCHGLHFSCHPCIQDQFWGFCGREKSV